MKDSSIIALENVSVSYGKRLALQSISGVFRKGSLTAVAGPNGSGKSTLLKVIAGVIRPTNGKVLFAKGGKRNVAYLPQSTHLQRDFPISVEEVVITGFYPQMGERADVSQDHRKQARAALSEVGLSGYEERPVNELSGGEFQRALFARVLVQNASIVLLDEPFTGVDAETTTRLIRLLLKWHDEGRTVICVLHDLLLIKKYFPESMILRGKCLGSGHTHEMFEQKLLSFDLDMAELFASDEKRASSGHGHHHDA